MGKPKISIIVTIYNIEKELERCLNSVVNQSLKEIEIICVNDGSTDNSSKIIDKFYKKYPKIIKPFTKENGGGDWGARNFGLKKVKADYFVFVDGDDYVHPDFAKKLYDSIHNNGTDMAVCALDRIDIKTGKLVTTDMNKFGYKTIDVDGTDSILAFINPGPCNKVYRKITVEGIEFKAVRGSCDLFFMLTAMPRIKKISFVPDSLYYYMMHNDSQIFNIKDHDLKVFEENFLEVKRIYKETASARKLLNYLDLMAFIHFGISIMYRVSYNSQNIKKDSKNILLFLNTNFPNWKKSPFLKFGYSLKKGFKHFAMYGVNIVYKWNMPLLFIKPYRFMIDKLKIDIKF
ncbi:MAG: glycosyltransferase family 2 protein [Bacilli bacterium]